MTVIHKQTSSEVDPSTLEYVMSDGSVDRMGDIIDPKGWRLDTFKKNPIALFGHSGGFPVGTWKDIRVEGGKLKGKLQFARPGTSERIDEIRSLAEQGILRAVSVGFQPVPGKVEPIKDSPRNGLVYREAELVECSVVSVPANPNALQIARGLGVSDDTIEMVFGKAAKDDQIILRDLNGKSADNHFTPRSKPMKISEQIELLQQKQIAQRDAITDLATKVAEDSSDDNVTALDLANAELDRTEKTLETLRNTEQRLALASTPANGVAKTNGIAPRPFAAPVEKVKPADLVIRSLVARVHGYASRGELSPSQALAIRYGEDGHVSDEQKVIFETVCRAATAPATTSTSGWASQLVTTAYAQFQELLLPASVYPGLSQRGLRLAFGRNGVISIPTRSATPTISGAFVLEGNPIPVKQGAFSAQTLTPKKLGVITTFTREIAEYSNPAIEGLLRNAIQEDTSVALDTVLLDATAASTTRPAGLRNGVTVTTATAGGGFAALVGDIKNLVGALITASNGNIRNPVWIMNPVQAIAISLTQNAGGDFPFAAEINGGRFQGYPIIQSSTMTAGMVVLLDADDFVSVEGDAPTFIVSDQATLHLDDSAPLAIGTAGSPATVAAPVRSLFQTDSLGLRMVMQVNWTLRRTGTLAWTQSVTW
jgi:HK97 family phage major capsid protein/HK97 family phage prohead protease